MTARVLTGWNEPPLLEGALAARREGRPVLLLNPAVRELLPVRRWLGELGVPPAPAQVVPAQAPLLEGLPPGFHALLLTSGTTGMPRLAALDEASVAWNTRAVGGHLGLAGNTCVVLQVPVFHAFGLVLGLYLSQAEARLQVFPRFDPEGLLAWLVRRDPGEGPLLLPLVPGMVRRLPAPGALSSAQRARLEGVEGVAIVGGDVVRRSDLARLRALFPGVTLTVGYGLTEAGPALAHTAPLVVETFVDGMVGAPLPGVELFLGGPRDGARFRSPGQAAFLREPGGPWRPSRGAGGLVDTGDLLAPEDSGEGFRFRGRAGWSFKKEGEAVSPVWVEEALLAGVERALGSPPADAALTLVVARGEGGGIQLFVEGARTEALEEALGVASREIPSFFRPERTSWVAALPRNALGKVERGRLGSGKGGAHVREA
jgi:acyl-CoA synthetase (AMP-forming)/AMP-acid ligase II